MKTERFTVLRDGLKIHGIAYLCEGNGASNSDTSVAGVEANKELVSGTKKFPAIIMSHGYMGSLGGYAYYAEKFCGYGYNVYTFNFSGATDETNPELKSEGELKDMTIQTEIADLTEVYNYVANQPDVKSDEIYLWGESQGAFVSGLTAARLQEKIKKLIMVFPAVCIPDHARTGRLGWAEYDPKNPPETMDTPWGTLGRGLHDGVKDMNPYFELAKYKGQTLLLQGLCDSVVVPQYQYLVKDAFDKTDALTVTDDTLGEGNEVSVGAGNAADAEKNVRHRLHLQMIREMDHWTGGEHKEAIADSIKYFIDGREEVFSFRIIVTEVIPLDDNDKVDVNRDETEDNKKGNETETDMRTAEILAHSQDVYFTGYCESELFTGTITSGVDHQTYLGDKCLKMHAEYTFSGVDSEGQKCEMEVCNRFSDGHWKPEIKTDSKALSWLNESDLFAVMEPEKTGPTIRIYK